MAHWNPSGKLAVVTGASSGIGRCLSKQLVARRCCVIAVARRGDRLQELADQIGRDRADGMLLPIVGDVTDPQTRGQIESQVRSRGGRLDLLVNNAGIGGIGPFERATESRLRKIMEVNFFAPAELTRRLMPYLKSSGDAVICNLGSVLGHRAVPDKSEYCASKFAMHGWSDALRAELAGASVQVTLVSPSTTRSEFFDTLVESDAGATSKSIGSWPAERVAAATLTAIRKRRAEVVLSVGGKLLVYADRLCPPLMNWLLQKRSGQ
ncbi:3-oxoacyl-[acyl-carrier-protein] reductase FabG [Stieleria maiorica]|uniref:3-oxoacyl-[acyl-carrier-protein] reductase FabG n=1 Tax=Stieleria maiorica TaxID=2795974 RepID=A0A5B9MIL4_9BACT|nr:SDR family NAD(P)-dependent oxidoreductase [Stieleria maiorica]QEF99846.1 3-oxoacyl-[acyl-carrier-protein] reductase FabG [Stieleria maiorica]